MSVTMAHLRECLRTNYLRDGPPIPADASSVVPDVDHMIKPWQSHHTHRGRDNPWKLSLALSGSTGTGEATAAAAALVSESPAPSSKSESDATPAGKRRRRATLVPGRCNGPLKAEIAANRDVKMEELSANSKVWMV